MNRITYTHEIDLLAEVIQALEEIHEGSIQMTIRQGHVVHVERRETDMDAEFEFFGPLID